MLVTGTGKSKPKKKKATQLQRVPSHDDPTPITHVQDDTKADSDHVEVVGSFQLSPSEPFSWERCHDENELQECACHHFECLEKRPELKLTEPISNESIDNLSRDQEITTQLKNLSGFVTMFEECVNRGLQNVSADLLGAVFDGLICLASSSGEPPPKHIKSFRSEVDRFDALLKRLRDQRSAGHAQKKKNECFDPGYTASDQARVYQEALAKKEKEFNQIRRSKDEELAKQKAESEQKQKQIADSAKKKLSKQKEDIQELTQKLKKSDEEKRKLRDEIDALKAAPQRDPEQEKRLSGKLIAQMTASQSQLDWRVAKLKLLHQKELSALQ